VVNNVHTGDKVTAALNQGSQSQTFNADRDSDVGLSFHFDPHGGNWTPGNATVTVMHGVRMVGSVSFVIKN